MLRVFVYEHLCATGGTGSLRSEGWAMLAAALTDMAACHEVRVVTLVEPSQAARVRAIPGDIDVRHGDARRAYLTAAKGCDFALVIAPEFDDILATRCEWALEAGCTLLGPSPEAVRFCADKLRLAERLRNLLPDLIPATAPYDPTHLPDGFPCVVKPRCGAGAQVTFIVHSAEEFAYAGDLAAAQGHTGKLIVQPFCRGLAASNAAILRPPPPGPPIWTVVLPPCEQFIETTSPSGQLRYAGGSVSFPIGKELLWPAEVRLLWSMIPGLSGYFGIDLVFDLTGVLGIGRHFIEINPRLTTSYIGLRRLCKMNLMQLLLDVMRGESPPVPTWRTGRVRFDPDGTVYED